MTTIRLYYYRPDGAYEGWGLSIGGVAPVAPHGHDSIGAFWDVAAGSTFQIRFDTDTADPSEETQKLPSSGVAVLYPSEYTDGKGHVRLIPIPLGGPVDDTSKLSKRVDALETQQLLLRRLSDHLGLTDPDPRPADISGALKVARRAESQIASLRAVLRPAREAFARRRGVTSEKVPVGGPIPGDLQAVLRLRALEALLSSVGGDFQRMLQKKDAPLDSQILRGFAAELAEAVNDEVARLTAEDPEGPVVDAQLRTFLLSAKVQAAQKQLQDIGEGR